MWAPDLDELPEHARLVVRPHEGALYASRVDVGRPEPVVQKAMPYCNGESYEFVNTVGEIWPVAARRACPLK